MAAIVRTLMDETARAMGFCTATLLLDIKNLHANMGSTRLVETGLDPGSPAAASALETQPFMAPRRLRQQK